MNEDFPFPDDYEVIDSSELDAMAPATSDLVDGLTDEQAQMLAELVRRQRLQRCAVERCKKPAAYQVGDENGNEYGLCQRHGKRLYARHNPPAMAVPRGRRQTTRGGR